MLCYICCCYLSIYKITYFPKVVIAHAPIAGGVFLQALQLLFHKGLLLLGHAQVDLGHLVLVWLFLLLLLLKLSLHVATSAMVIAGQTILNWIARLW